MAIGFGIERALQQHSALGNHAAFVEFQCLDGLSLFYQFAFALSRFGAYFQARLTKFFKQRAMIGINGVAADTS